MITLHPDSHVDHGLTPDQLAHVLDLYRDRDGFFVATAELPPDLGTVPCGLYGPAAGDAPIPAVMCERRRRGDRAYGSRVLINGRPRPSRLVTVIAGPHDGASCVLYTAFGGPPSPKEPDDPTLGDDQRAESVAFWAEHALAEQT